MWITILSKVEDPLCTIEWIVHNDVFTLSLSGVLTSDIAATWQDCQCYRLVLNMHGRCQGGKALFNYCTNGAIIPSARS